MEFMPTSIPTEIPDNNEPIGFIMPVYFWGIPSVALRFAKALKINGSHKTYTVLTCSGSTGNAAKMFEKALGRKIDAHFSVLMPDTFAPMYDCGNKSKSDSVLTDAEVEITAAIDMVKRNVTGSKDIHRGMKGLATATMYPIYKRCTTKHFRVTDNCIGCGLCESLCPDHMIEISDGRPQWQPGHCELCFACLHHCPQFAIEYTRHSRTNGQYVCPKSISV